MFASPPRRRVTPPSRVAALSSQLLLPHHDAQFINQREQQSAFGTSVPPLRYNLVTLGDYLTICFLFAPILSDTLVVLIEHCPGRRSPFRVRALPDALHWEAFAIPINTIPLRLPYATMRVVHSPE